MAWPPTGEVTHTMLHISRKKECNRMQEGLFAQKNLVIFSVGQPQFQEKSTKTSRKFLGSELNFVLRGQNDCFAPEE